MRASFGLLLRLAAIRWACNLTLGPRQRERPGVDVVRDFQAEVSGPSQRVSRLSAVRTKRTYLVNLNQTPWSSLPCPRIEAAVLLMLHLAMQIGAIKKAVRSFRSALDSSHKRFGPEFSDFPRGCCGAVAELLAAFLKDEGLGTFAYVSGWREDRTMSHAWLEGEGLIIDATADQFEDQQEQLLVTLDSTWHNQFSALRERRADGDFRHIRGAENLHSVYAHVLRKVYADRE